MTKGIFTDAQAAHALGVVLKLMKEHRFFLYQNDRRAIENKFDFTLDPQVFGPAIKLDRKIREAYATARVAAEETILKAESKLGVTKSDLSGNKQLVQCHRYTGGLDICCVYPLTAFLQYAPKSLEILTEQCLQQILEDKTEDDLAPKVLRQKRDYASRIAEKIWAQLEAMGVREPNNARCVVMMETRFDCSSSDENHDFMQGRTRGMQKFPHAMGYLFYRYSLHNTRIVRHSHVVCSTSRRSHVNIQHWSNEKKPHIYYDADSGYTCSVFFVTVL